MVKRGALELSVGTIVILVLAMSMLILGIVLIRNIFDFGNEAVELIDSNVKAQINDLFNEDDSQKTTVYLPGGEAVIQPGNRYNIRFAIKNVLTGVSGAQEFRYAVSVAEIEPGCQLTLAKANGFIVQGKSSSVKIAPGAAPEERTIVISVPEGSPLCTLTYNIDVTQAGTFYDGSSFLVTITS
ncbi:MAG: hypothetical protein AABW79_04410 [Nanoarchaeota archaeon]